MPESAYDVLPYQSLPFAQTHPDRLAGIATLLGLRPPPVETARVLELGAAAGGNLIPMAEQLPDATFLGIDLSARQVADGRESIRALGLTNIELRQADILSIDPSAGTFDYVIAHGVYSWVPDQVQDHILKVCRRNLSPDGVAYVSYNTLPGWSMRGMIRQMMLFHGRRFADAAEQVRQSRAILDFLAKAAAADTPYGTFLRSELEALQQASDYYIFHEHLEENNHPCLFSEFADRAAKHGLRFLAEADLQTMVPAHFPREVQDVLHRVSGDTVVLEQYMDFLRNRMFRQTLLVPDDRQPAYELTPPALAGMYVAAAIRPADAALDLQAEGFAKFPAVAGMTLQASEPIVKAALAELAAAWPRRLAFEELCRRARARLGGAQADDAERIGLALLQFYTAGGSRVVEVAPRPLPVAIAVGDRPAVSPLARRQADRGEPVTTRRHEGYQPGDFEREVLRHLNGANDRRALLEGAMEAVKAGKLTVEQDGRPVTDTAAEPLVDRALNEVLGRLVRYSLIAPAG
jgi:methyltransferase-like protein/2-polyprenyl-3-methyl-5-hydroxy-6-metoxy-1,4-benzoquinol methylase